MNDTVHRHFRRTTAALVALALVLSVFGPVGTALAQPSVSVSQSADATTVAPGDSVTFTTDFTVAELNAPQLQVTTPSGWTIESQSATGPAAYNDGTWTWLAGDNEGVNVSYTVEYTVSVPASASPGDYTVAADGSALSPSDSSATAASDATTITVAEPDQNEAPSASFSASPASPEAGEQVSFDASASTDPDGSIASYEWDFDDGETATGESPTHVFDSAGDYDVELTVTDDDGATDTTTQTISVSEPPTPASFQVSTLTVESPVIQGDDASVTATVENTGEASGTQTVTLAVDGSQVDSESVTLAGGATQQVDFTVDTTGLSVDDHDVTVATDDDSATDTLTVNMLPPSNQDPAAVFTASPSAPETGEQVSFDASASTDPDGSITSYEWDFDDGETATGESPTHVFDSAGDYDVELTVTDDDGATDTTTQTVSVSEAPPANQAPSAAFTVSPGSPETGETATFDAAPSTDADGSIASYEWDFDDGETATGVTAVHAFDSAGDYDVELTVTDDDGATDTATQTITVTAPTEPEPGLTTAVSLSPSDELVGVNSSTTFDVVVENADGGVGAYSLDVSLTDGSVASITDVSVDDAALSDVQIAGDGSAASADVALLDTAQSGSVSVATVTVTGDADGTTDVEIDVTSLGTESGQAYNVSATNGATLTVSELVVGASDQPAQDPDDDGVYEDVNGDGVVDELDVQLLFAERDSSVVQNSPDAFDFNGDGEFDILDVQALYYEEVA